MHYYKRNLGDYAKKAGRLSMLQHGSYTLLIDACYDREQFPTLDDAIEWTWASTTEEIEAVTFVLRKFFTLENGVYVQKRIQEEIAEYHSKAETNKRIAIDRETKRKENNTNRAEDNTNCVQGVNEPPPNHKPLTNNHKPITNNQEPQTNSSKPEDLASIEGSNPSSPQKNGEAPSEKLDGETEFQIACRQTWASYKNAYLQRYGVEPIRNATVNTQVKNFVKRIGQAESPSLAAWFLNHTDSFYAKGGHVFGLLTKDAEKLRTEWATGNVIEIEQYKSTGQKRIENTNKAVAEFLGADQDNQIIEGEYQHA